MYWFHEFLEKKRLTCTIELSLSLTVKSALTWRPSKLFTRHLCKYPLLLVFTAVSTRPWNWNINCRIQFLQIVPYIIVKGFVRVKFQSTNVKYFLLEMQSLKSVLHPNLPLCQPCNGRTVLGGRFRLRICLQQIRPISVKIPSLENRVKFSRLSSWEAFFPPIQFVPHSRISA